MSDAIARDTLRYLAASDAGKMFAVLSRGAAASVVVAPPVTFNGHAVDSRL